MGGKVQSGNLAHDAACSVIEATRQVAVAAAGTGPSGQKASDAAEIIYHRGIIASCKANNSSNGLAESLMALRSLGVTA
jgi:hypothetical protein